MGGVVYSLGRMVGPKVRKAKWVFRSMTGSEADALQAEFEVGRDMAHEVECQVDIDREPAVRQLLSEVGDRLTGRLTNRRRVFTFRATRFLRHTSTPRSTTYYAQHFFHPSPAESLSFLPKRRIITP